MIFPIACGLLLDKFPAAGNVTGGYTVLLLICAFAYVVAFALKPSLRAQIRGADSSRAGEMMITFVCRR